MNRDAKVVLVADDDEDIAQILSLNLRLGGLDVAIALDGLEVLRSVRRAAPDLVLLDIMLPSVDGFEICRRLRADFKTRHIPVIMLTAKSLREDKMAGLAVGADDYLTKPFDIEEIVARVKCSLRRSSEMRDVNPLTRLPGNVVVHGELDRLIGSATVFALMYVDLDNFKAFNDYYGFMRGDEAIRLLARCICGTVEGSSSALQFVGHIGGDDFLVIVSHGEAQRIAQTIIGEWDRLAPGLYDPADAARGHIEVTDRRYRIHRFPIMTVSIGIASNARRTITSHWEAAEIAAEVKRFAKREPRSSSVFDRRTSG